MDYERNTVADGERILDEPVRAACGRMGERVAGESRGRVREVRMTQKESQ